MMKKLKQFGALMLALVLAVALCCPALAAGNTTGSITINNAVKDKTYTVYRIFDLDTYSADYKAITYKISDKWNGFFAENAAGLEYVDIDANRHVTLKSGKGAAEFATAAYNYAKNNNIQEEAQSKASNNSVEFKNLPLGYYLVQSDLGALCALDTTTPDVTMTEKNGQPTVDKKVEEDSKSALGKVNDADIGQIVKFETTINVIDGQPKNYVLHDKMDTGLTFVNDQTNALTVEIGDKTLSASGEEGYTLKTSGITDGCTFEIVFGAQALKANDVVTVTYYARLNEDAVIAGEGNLNKTMLDYGDNQRTTWDQTRTYTWQMDVFKYTGNDTPLAGAQFKLYKQSGASNLYATLEQVKDAEGKDTNTWRVTGWDANGTVFTSPEGGNLSIIGLDADTYYLEEIQAPDGYNKLSAPIEVTVTSTPDTANTMTSQLTVNKAPADKVNVQNNAGTELPTTGGMGTTVLYVVGGALVVCAGVALVAKKRMQ